MLAKVHLNPFTLTFDSEALETEYWKQYMAKMRGKSVIAVTTVMVMYFLFGFLDSYIIPDIIREIWIIRGVILVQCLTLIVLIRTPLFERKHQVLLGSLPVTGGLGILLIIALSRAQAMQYYYVALILACIWTLLFADLRFIYALPICLVYVIGYEFIAFSVNSLPLPVVINNSFFLIGGLIMAAPAGYAIERHNRQAFCQSLLIEEERSRSESLLLNILPKEITETLKDRNGSIDNQTIAERYEEASILFADIVHFTELSAQMAPEEMVDLLNDLFSYFDTLVEKYGLEKIRTIGDNYMVASGVPRPRADHAQALARLALEMLEYSCSSPKLENKPFQLRIGINSGPVVAGVIGRKKFQYDIWGEAVNTASRMESQGQPGRIQITEATYDRLKEAFACEPRGAIAVKGVGEMHTWFLVKDEPSSVCSETSEPVRPAPGARRETSLSQPVHTLPVMADKLPVLLEA